MDDVTISSRTPEGFPSRCPLCGARTRLEFSDRTGDAPCPSCGHLLWKSTELLEKAQRHVAASLVVTPERISSDSNFSELGADSLDEVELLMELQEEFGISIPDDVAERIQTLGDAIRYIEAKLREQRGEEGSL